jgi:hypothetical protein
MAHADEAALKTVALLLRQLREIQGLRETKPGTYQVKGSVFIQFHDEAGALFAELRKAGGSGFDRYPVDAAPGQRKLVEDAKRRVAKLDED